MTLKEMIETACLTKTKRKDTIDVCFVSGERATFTKLFLEEHKQDPETAMIVDNESGEIIFMR